MDMFFDLDLHIETNPDACYAFTISPTHTPVRFDGNSGESCYLYGDLKSASSDLLPETSQDLEGTSPFSFAFHYSQPFAEFMDCNYPSSDSDSDNDDTDTDNDTDNYNDDMSHMTDDTVEHSNCDISEVSPSQITRTSTRRTRRNHLFVLDWDDTIFPTCSFRLHCNKTDVNFKEKLSLLAFNAVCLLEEMIFLYGSQNIVIVTNASETWIEKCLNLNICKSAFQELNDLLFTKHNIRMISAANRCKLEYPNNHMKWKEIVFKDIFQETFLDSNNNINNKSDQSDGEIVNCITSIGDSIYEYHASDIASRNVPNRVLHRIKLKSFPSIDEMIIQLQEINNLVERFGTENNDINLVKN